MSRVEDVTPQVAWAALAAQPSAFLIDVRSQAEWTFVGVPDVSGLGKDVILIEWQMFPSMHLNGSFADTLQAVLMERGGGQNSPLYFLCRSGGRSRSAAQKMAGLGFQACFNVEGGFEGDPDAQRHRGRLSGWKAANLPWVQN